MLGVLENKISQVVEKIRQIEVEISNENGSFNLFALIEREDSLGKWDIIVSANWIGNNEKTFIKLLASKISEKFNEEEQIKLSRIIVLPSSDPLIRIFNMIGVEHGTVKLNNHIFNGILIKEAYLITSKA